MEKECENILKLIYQAREEELASLNAEDKILWIMMRLIEVKNIII